MIYIHKVKCYLIAIIDDLGYSTMTQPKLLSLLLSILLLTSCATTQKIWHTSSTQPSLSTPPVVAGSGPVNLAGFPNNAIFWQGTPATTWEKLQHVPLPELQSAALQSTDSTIITWLKLASIGKQYSTNTGQLVNQLIAWRNENPNHPANALFPTNDTLTTLQTALPPKRIVLLLPLQGQLGASGQAVRDGFLNAYYQSPYKNQQTVSFSDTTKTANITTLYQQAIDQGASAVVGPLTKAHVQQLAKQGHFPVPTIALNYTDVWLGSLPTNFYEFGLSPLDEAKQLAEKAWQSGHQHALIIAPDDAWGQRVVKTVSVNWIALGGSISDTYYFTPQTDLTKGIANLLQVNATNNSHQERRQDFDAIFLLTPPQSARQILPLLKFYYAGRVPVYSTSVIYSGRPTPEKDLDLNGVNFSDIPWTLEMAKNGGAQSHFNRLYAVGRDAYLLSGEINRLSILPNFPIYGATGALTLTSQQQIYRRLAWTQMRDGRP